MSNLATLDELPASYRQGLTDKNLVALWPLMRTALPHDKPDRRTQPVVWRYRDIRPDMLRAAELTPLGLGQSRTRACERAGDAVDLHRPAADHAGRDRAQSPP